MKLKQRNIFPFQAFSKLPVAKLSKESVITHDASLIIITISLAKTLHVWRVKMNFISNKSVNEGTLSQFKHSLTPCKNQRYENSKLPLEKSSNESVITHDASPIGIYNARNNFLSLARQYRFRFQ